MDDRPWKNSEGYSDPTAYGGIRAADREAEEQQKRFNELLYVIKYIIKKSGFEMTNRIDLKDIKTGKVFR